MNTQGYIKAAVELADGWREECHATTRLLDALAAQLVRQCDTIGYEVESYMGCSLIDVSNNKLVRIDGPDRTLNTIKAIVDSGVLE